MDRLSLAEMLGLPVISDQGEVAPYFSMVAVAALAAQPRVARSGPSH